MTQAAQSPTKPSAGAMAPFKHQAFLVLWLATVVSNIGTWMHDVGAGWLMTELAPSPLMVAAVQAATTLPIFLFALIAGAVADIVDKRKLLITINIVMGIAAFAMTALVHFGLITPALLLLFTFLFGTGAAFMAPAWQAIVPKLVPREELTSAVALNSMGINVSRAIGPALAGVLIVSAGLAAPFLVNALSFIGIIAALYWWRAVPNPSSGLPAEHMGSAILSGLRYAWNSKPLKMTLVRAAAFFVFASAFWAMLPLIARQVLSGGPTLYGLLMASVGTGAVLGAFVLGSIKSKLGADRTCAVGTFGVATVMITLATVPNEIVAIAASALAGLSWIIVLSSLNVSAQTSLPDWVRARGLSIFLTVFFGSMSLGSLMWGQVASIWGIPLALIAAGVGALLFVPLTFWAKLGLGTQQDLSPSMHWPEPILSEVPTDDRPVMIQITYRINAAQKSQFLSMMDDLAESRRRGGAYRWSLMQDAAEPNRFVETWMEASWLQHQRHHERVTKEDQALQERIRKTLADHAAPEVTHHLTPKS